MSTFWNFFWPLFSTGLVIGVIAGTVAFRLPIKQLKDAHAGVADTPRIEWRKRAIALAVGTMLSLAPAGLWSGPLGAADRLATQVEHDARFTLDNYEMTQITGHLHRAPLSRTLILSGPADDFQRSELVRILSIIPGVSRVRWSNRGGVPLIAEAAGAAILGFLLGLLIAYVAELRRRYNSQWSW
jgi:uncharacterized membrane-anchored protein YhcB (DUF1043 family)